MAFSLRRKHGNAIEQPESELESLRSRKATLQSRLAAAERDLARALNDRRHRLLEADLDATGGQPVKNMIGRLRDERDACFDALASVNLKIKDVQERLHAATSVPSPAGRLWP